MAGVCVCLLVATALYCGGPFGCAQVLLGLHKAVPDLVGLDVDMAATAAAVDRLADADRLMAGGSSSSSGAGGGPGRGGYQHVPACLLGAIRAAYREVEGWSDRPAPPGPGHRSGGRARVGGWGKGGGGWWWWSRCVCCGSSTMGPAARRSELLYQMWCSKIHALLACLTTLAANQLSVLYKCMGTARS